MSDLQSGDPVFKSRFGHLLDLFSVVPSSNPLSPAMLVNNQLVASCQFGYLILLCSMHHLLQNFLSGVPVN